ncbi:MAG: zinc-ribbon domain-containing protein [Candidatus Heimdallarchaeaceae archaeon]
MSFRRSRTFNGVLFTLFAVLITLLVLGIVTRRAVFYILFGVVLFLTIASVIGLFTFLRKTAAGSPSVSRSTYDITEGKDYASMAPPKKQEEKDRFCDNCGMKLKPGETICSNCGKRQIQ